MDRMPDESNRRPDVESLELQKNRALPGRSGIVRPRQDPSPPRGTIVRRIHRSAFLAAVHLASAGPLAGCAGPLSSLDPDGPAASSIATLWWVMLAGATALFVLVMILLVLPFVYPRLLRSVRPARWIVLGGLVLPALLLLPLVAYGLIAGERLLPLPGQAPMRIEATGHQWHWTFRYPDHGGTTSEDVIHLPAATPVDIMVASLDVIHAFWIPRLAGKIDAIPGQVNVLRIQADQPGRYRGLCNEFCGLGHGTMRFDVVVHPAGDFDEAISTLTSPAEKAAS